MNRAVLVIDVQREYFDGSFPVYYPGDSLSRILELMDAAKKANIPTVVVRHHQAPGTSAYFRKGSDLWQLHPEVESRPRDALIDKQLPGSFTNTPLDLLEGERYRYRLHRGLHDPFMLRHDGARSLSPRIQGRVFS